MFQLHRFNRSEDGATLIEYGIAVLVAVAVGTAGVTIFADEINDNIETACDLMSADGDTCS